MKHQSYIQKPDGAKCAVLMVHGICGTPRHFDFLLPAFDDSWAVYNILLTGHGGSVQDFSRSSMKAWQTQVCAALDDLSAQYEKLLVVGHSMGALLLLQTLSHYPKICGCVLFNPPMYPRMRPVMATRALRLAFGTPRADDPQEMLCRQDNSITLSNNPFLYIGWIPRFLELLTLCRQSRRQAGPLSVPSLVYFGTADELVSIRSKRYFEMDPQIRLAVLENTGHFGFLPQAQAMVFAQVREFIAKLFS